MARSKEKRKPLFRISFKGYNRQEVEDYVERIQLELAEKEKEIERLRQELVEKDGDLLMKQAIESAEKIAQQLKETAKKESEMIIKEAKIKAETLLREADKKYEQLFNKVLELKREFMVFKTRFQNFLQAEIEAVDGIETIDENSKMYTP